MRDTGRLGGRLPSLHVGAGRMWGAVCPVPSSGSQGTSWVPFPSPGTRSLAFGKIARSPVSPSPSHLRGRFDAGFATCSLSQQQRHRPKPGPQASTSYARQKWEPQSVCPFLPRPALVSRKVRARQAAPWATPPVGGLWGRALGVLREDQGRVGPQRERGQALRLPPQHRLRARWGVWVFGETHLVNVGKADASSAGYAVVFQSCRFWKNTIMGSSKSLSSLSGPAGRFVAALGPYRAPLLPHASQSPWRLVGSVASRLLPVGLPMVSPHSSCFQPWRHSGGPGCRPDLT